MMLTKKVVLVIIFTVVAIVTVALIGFYFANKEKEVQDDASPVPIIGPIELPKAPHWDEATQSLYFVDVYQSVVHKYVPKTNTHTFALVDGGQALAFIIPIKDTKDKFIISYGPTIAIITWDGESTRVSQLQQISQIDADVYRANEGKVSPSGNLFVGTHTPFNADGSLGNGTAGLYSFSKTRTIKKLLSNVVVSNGMQWSADQQTFYYIDSLAYNVESFSYNIHNDELTNRKVIFDFKKNNIPGVPDGMTIDNEDKIWVTSFGGHQVLRIDPESGSLLQTIRVDALQVTSAAFVLNDFYITSGVYKLSGPDRQKYPHSGWIYKIANFTVSGRAGVPFEYN